MNAHISLKDKVLSKRAAIDGLLRKKAAGLANLRNAQWNNFDNYSMRDDSETEWNNWVNWDQNPNPFSNSD